LTEDLPLPLES